MPTRTALILVIGMALLFPGCGEDEPDFGFDPGAVPGCKELGKLPPQNRCKVFLTSDVLLPEGGVGEVELFCNGPDAPVTGPVIQETESDERAEQIAAQPESFDIGAGGQRLREIREVDPEQDLPGTPRCYEGISQVGAGSFYGPSMTTTVRRCALPVGRYVVHADAEFDREFGPNATALQRSVRSVNPEAAEGGLTLGLEWMLAGTEPAE